MARRTPDKSHLFEADGGLLCVGERGGLFKRMPAVIRIKPVTDPLENYLRYRPHHLLQSRMP